MASVVVCHLIVNICHVVVNAFDLSFFSRSKVFIGKYMLEKMIYPLSGMKSYIQGSFSIAGLSLSTHNQNHGYTMVVNQFFSLNPDCSVS